MPVEGNMGGGSLRWFTDRAQLIRRFLDYVYGVEPVGKMLYFWGDGGNGKSKLLEMLSSRFCRFLPGVEAGELGLGHETYEDLMRRFAGDAVDRDRRVAKAVLDFDALPQGEDNPKEAFSALFMLRRALGSQGVRFPRFDYAGVVYLMENHRATPDRLKELFPSEEYEFANALIGLLGDLPAVGWVTKAIDTARKGWDLVGKRSKAEDRVTLFLQSRGVELDTAKRIHWMNAEFGKELYGELPALMAADLNEALKDGAKKGEFARIVLFFDTLEALNKQDRNAGRFGFFRSDEWLRRLVGGLDFGKGIVVVVAGRDELRWGDAPEYKVRAERIEVRQVEQFSDSDAAVYLEKRGVVDVGLRDAIIGYASTRKDDVHPLLLGMAADVLELAGGKGETLGAGDFRNEPEMSEKEQLLIDRLLRYMDDEEEYAIRALSVCRTFGYGVYRELGEKIGFMVSRPLFDRLVKYSFVTAVQGGDGQQQYRIHGLLRRLMFEHGDAVVKEADGVMEEYYGGLVEGKKDELAVVEKVYHVNRLDWERGVDEWADVFDAALRMSRFELCESLLGLIGELRIVDDFQLARVLNRYGDYYAVRTRFEQAEEGYRKAIEAYDRALPGASDELKVFNNKGIVHAKLGELLIGLGKGEEAEENFRAAIEAFDASLTIDPLDQVRLTNKGNVLGSIGDLQAGLGKGEEAEASYGLAIEWFGKALAISAENAIWLNNVGEALGSLGSLQAGLGKAEEAEVSFRAAIEWFDKAIALDGDDARWFSNKGNVLGWFGDLQAGLGRTEEARASFGLAIQAFDKSISLAADYLNAHYNKGMLMRSLGDAKARLGHDEEAGRFYRMAVESFEKALSLAPNFVKARSNLDYVVGKL